jgi:hypothetical protein
VESGKRALTPLLNGSKARGSHLIIENLSSNFVDCTLEALEREEHISLTLFVDISDDVFLFDNSARYERIALFFYTASDFEQQVQYPEICRETLPIHSTELTTDLGEIDQGTGIMFSNLSLNLEYHKNVARRLSQGPGK